MPAIIVAFFAFLGALLVSLFGYFAEYLTKRLLIIAAAIAALIATTIAFFSVIETLMTTLLLNVPADVADTIGLFMPSNFTACITAIITAKVARWAYEWQLTILKLKVF